ncbi:MAG TPA: OsmC family protein [Micromonosporaceae bacterium]
MTDDNTRSVVIERVSVGRYLVRNRRGGSISIGSGEGDDFTPVELLLAAIGGCTGIDVDLITSRRAEPDQFSVRVNGEKFRDDAGNRMRDLTVEFTVSFPDGEAGDAAREALPRAVRQSHDRLCIVSRTVELGTPVATRVQSPAELA